MKNRTKPARSTIPPTTMPMIAAVGIVMPLLKLGVELGVEVVLDVDVLYGG